MPDPMSVTLDHPTIEHTIKLLEDRLLAVTTYGAGGCPTCHDAELRGAIALLRRLVARGEASPTNQAPASVSTRRRR